MGWLVVLCVSEVLAEETGLGFSVMIDVDMKQQSPEISANGQKSRKHD